MNLRLMICILHTKSHTLYVQCTVTSRAYIKFNTMHICFAVIQSMCKIWNVSAPLVLQSYFSQIWKSHVKSYRADGVKKKWDYGPTHKNHLSKATSTCVRMYCTEQVIERHFLCMAGNNLFLLISYWSTAKHSNGNWAILKIVV